MGISQKNPVFTFLTHPSTQNPFSVEHREISVACVSHPLLYIFLRSATSVSDSSVWWLHTYFFDCSRWSTPFTSCDQMSWADARRGHQITKCRSFHCPILWRQRFFFLSFTAALWALTLLSSNKTIKKISMLSSHQLIRQTGCWPQEYVCKRCESHATNISQYFCDELIIACFWAGSAHSVQLMNS